VRRLEAFATKPTFVAHDGAMDEEAAEDRVSVLVADDEPDMRLMLRLHFDRDPRFEIAGEAVDGMDAVSFCEQHMPDLVLLDVRMPRLDGIAALPLLRQRCPGARVALFTAFAETVDREIVREHDAVMFEKGDPLPWLADRLFEFARHETN
jgi:CheY-like chemotaxis protein